MRRGGGRSQGVWQDVRRTTGRKGVCLGVNRGRHPHPITRRLLNATHSSHQQAPASNETRGGKRKQHSNSAQHPSYTCRLTSTYILFHLTNETWLLGECEQDGEGAALFLGLKGIRTGILAKPIASLEEAWRCLWGEDLEHAVKAAFVQLHARRVCHGDVSSSNVLVEWKKVAVQSGALPTSATTLEAWSLRGMVQEAQKQMHVNYEAFCAAAREVGQHAQTKMEHASGVASEVSESPLSRLRCDVRPHVWIVDFADSTIVQEGEEGDALLASEARDVEKALRRWMIRRF